MSEEIIHRNPEEEARGYRLAAQSYLGGTEVEAAGIFERWEEGWGQAGWMHVLGWLYGKASPFGALRGSFLLAVTRDKVHAFEYSGVGKYFKATHEIAVFERGDVWLQSVAGGEVVYLEGRGHQVDLDGAAVDRNPGAAEVLALLRRR